MNKHSWSRSHRPEPARKLGLRLALTALAASLLAACASAPPVASSFPPPGSKAEAISRLSDYIPKEMKAQGVSGLGIVVSDATGTLWASGFGVADKKSGRKFDASTISNIGSVSKLFTATAIMRLVQEGRIDLDAPVSTYLPDFAPKAGAYDPALVTIRGLLTHHSGLQSDYLKGFMSGSTQPTGYPRPYADNALLASETTLCAAPGEVMSYSNLGFSLLGLVVEAVSGKDFPSYIRDSIFAPLGMASSSFLIEDRFKDRYASNPAGGKDSGIPYIRDMPAGSLNASAEDMGRFLTAVISQGSGIEGGILDRATQAEMWTRQNGGSALDFDFSIGLGYWIMDIPALPGEKLVGHGGDLNNFHALFLVDPERDLGVFMMVNSAGGLGSFSLAEIGIEALRDFAAASGSTLAPPRAAAKSAAFPAGLAARISGDYASSNGFLRVKEKGDGASIYAFGNWMEGYYRDDGSIGLRATILGIELPISILKEIYLTVEDLKGESILAMRSRGILMGVARKVKPEPVPAAWLARSGTWVPAEKEAMPFMDALKLGVDKETGFLIASMVVQGQSQSYPIRAIADDAAQVLGSGRNLGATISIFGTGKDERLDVFGMKLKRK